MMEERKKSRTVRVQETSFQNQKHIPQNPYNKTKDEHRMYRGQHGVHQFQYYMLETQKLHLVVCKYLLQINVQEAKE